MTFKKSSSYLKKLHGKCSEVHHYTDCFKALWELKFNSQFTDNGTESYFTECAQTGLTAINPTFMWLDVYMWRAADWNLPNAIRGYDPNVQAVSVFHIIDLSTSPTEGVFTPASLNQHWCFCYIVYIWSSWFLFLSASSPKRKEKKKNFFKTYWLGHVYTVTSPKLSSD